jgi:hypothetical protein
MVRCCEYSGGSNETHSQRQQMIIIS